GNLTSSIYKTSATVSQTAIGSLTGNNFLALLGFWYPGIIVSIDEEDDLMPTPLITDLYSAMPNPFKTTTALSYSLATNEKVMLAIYDISGRLLTTLVNEKMPPGIYRVVWNGKNQRNQQVSAGIYFCQLKTANYSKTRKLLLTQ
ncbi:MAG: T9SS type A sorting domain-containing protein, partial [candidate division WOR-3 bacterium]